MIPEIKDKIDDIINPILTEHKKWQLYEECKNVVRSWEKNYTNGFSPDEYSEYIKYITHKLEI